MQLTAYLMVSVIVSMKSLSVRSCPPPSYSDSKNTRCFIADNVVVDGTKEDLENKTTWTVVDAAEGAVLIQFPFLNSSVGGSHEQCRKQYKLTLKVKDGQDFVDHSEHTVWVTNMNHSTFCDKVANVTFTHMYTGTYELRIDVGCYCWLRDIILIKNITTNYKKKKFLADNVVGIITPQYQLGEMRFTVNVDTSMKYTLKYTNSCTSDCITSSNPKPKCQWKVFHGVQRIYKSCIVGGCEFIEIAYPLCDWRVVYPRRNDTETSFCGGMVKGDYSEGKKYDFTVQNVSTGCYCITAEQLDSRVKEGVWNNVCRTTHSPFIYVKPGKTGGKTQVLNTTALPLPLIVTLCILLVFSPVMMWMLWKYLRGRVPETEKVDIPYCNNLKVIEKIPNAEILLLYPRDCEPFMKLMKQFKELLKTTCKCEVLDYYDQEHSAEIDKEGSTWLLKKINSPATKIILVESTCSILCQQAHFDGITIKPAIQHCRDNFFTLALIELASNKHTVFVIRFNLKDEVSFKCISRDVRYVMPYQLRKLVTAMGFYISENVVQIDKGMEMVLINNINCFIKYANENKYYIMDLYKKW